MKTIATITLAAAIALAALAGEPRWDGRAGATVGADRVEQLASYVSPRDLREFDAGDGRAGGAVAKAPVRAAPPDRKVDVAGAWLGRVGGPRPFGA